jgi:hypothetical protein
MRMLCHGRVTWMSFIRKFWRTLGLPRGTGQRNVANTTSCARVGPCRWGAGAQIAVARRRKAADKLASGNPMN